ncbi:MAG: glycosyltransferase family 4 protein [Bacteroidota bacterium]
MEGKTIAVNTRLLIPGKLDGIGWFTYHTLQRITRKHPETKFVYFFDRPWSEEFVFGPNVEPVSLFPQARHPLLYYWWFNYSIPAALKRHRADLFLSPDGYLSLRTNIPQLAVMHDLNFEHYPNDLPWLTSKYYRHFFPRFAQKAKRIATVSEFSKNDIIGQYGIDSTKIDVVYNGVNEHYQPLERAVVQSVRDKYTNGKPFFLFVGMLHSRKNISNMLSAFDRFRSSAQSDVKMLIVGHRKWWSDEMETTFQGLAHQNDVVFTGRLPIEELTLVTGAALAMTYVSYFEGFGVPIIEAMRAGVPVITSNLTSMPEVAGGAARLCDPFNVDSIAEAMNEVFKDESMRTKLIQAGLERSRIFNWDTSAEMLWSSICKCV